MGVKEKLSVMQIPSILLLGFVYVAYVLIGGVVFWKLEGDLGMKDVSYLRENKERLLSTYPCLNQAGLEAVAQVRNKNVEMKQTFYTYLQFMIARFDRPFLQLSLPLYLHLNHNHNDFAFLYSFMATVHHCGTLNTLTEGTNLLQFAFWNYSVVRSKYMLKLA